MDAAGAERCNREQELTFHLPVTHVHGAGVQAQHGYFFCWKKATFAECDEFLRVSQLHGKRRNALAHGPRSPAHMSFPILEGYQKEAGTEQNAAPPRIPSGCVLYWTESIYMPAILPPTTSYCSPFRTQIIHFCVYL